MVKLFGTAVEEESSGAALYGKPFNEPALKFNSTTPKPEKEKKGWFSTYVGTPVTSAVVGVGSGAQKIVEGFSVLGTTLIDLGVGTDLTKKVQKAFDDNDFFNKMEDLADDSWTGKVTEIITQLGVPGTVGLKAANALIKAKKAGALTKGGKISMIARRPALTKMAFTGLAEAGAATNDLHTLGDMMDVGLTKRRQPQGEKGRAEAFRNLTNKFKFGVEGALGFTLFDKVLIPGMKGAYQGLKPGFQDGFNKIGFENVLRRVEWDPVAKKNVIIDESIDAGFQFNKNNILRWVDKNILAPLRPRGNLPTEVFKANREKIGQLRSITEKVRGETLELEKAVQRIIDPEAGGWMKQLDEVGLEKRTRIMESIYDYLTSGHMTKQLKGAKKSGIPLDLKQLQKGLDDYNKLAAKKAKGIGKTYEAIPAKVLPFIHQIRKSIDNMSKEFLEVPGITKTLQSKFGAEGAENFKKMVAANVGEYLTRSYRMAGTKAEKSLWRTKLNNTPEGKEIMDRARAFIKKSNPGITDELVEEEIQRVLRTGGKAEQIGPILTRIKAVDDAVFKTRQQVPEELRALLGEIKDPTAQYYRTAAKINTFIEDTKFFNILKERGLNKFLFEPPPQLKGVPSPPGGATGQGGVEFTTQITSTGPLNGWYTNKNIAKALDGISDSTRNAEVLSGIYSKLFLAPKAFTQEAKTTLSPITHARNFISAASFTGMNGNFFRNPATVVKDFKEAWRMTTAISKNQLESTMGRRLFKSDDAYRKFADEYRELQKLGVVNTSARLGDLAKSLDEVSVGLQNLTEEGKIYTMLRGWGDKSGFSKLRGAARLAYQTEDDFYKIQNYYSERGKLREALGGLSPERLRKYVDKNGLAKKYGINNVNTKEGFDRLIKEEAADIVRNNIPNYDYVGSFTQAMRKLPIGNFISFPMEVMRTGFNTLRRGLKEVQDPITRGIGVQRLAGVATFGLALGKGLEEGAQLVSGTSNKTLNALKEYLPEWSKNSTLIPVKQGNQIYYIDFSHTNAYDVLTRPFRAAMNGFGRSQEEDRTMMQNFERAAIEAATEFASPFIEESIATQFFADVFLRGGQSKDGRRLWNPEDEFGTKVSNTMAELFKTASPGSIKQLHRIYLSGTGQLDQYNRGYKFLNESTGLFGFRIQDPFVEQGINFKIAENQRAVANSKKLFTSVAYRPDSTPEEITAAYENANRAKFENDQLLFKRIEAAKQLGMSKFKIRKIIKARYPGTTGTKIMNNQFTPMKVPGVVFKKIKENALQRGNPDPSWKIRGETNKIYYKSLFNNRLFDSPSTLFEESINVIEDRERPITTPAYRTSSTALRIPINTGGAPNLFGSTFVEKTGGGTGTLDPAAKLALAKSGNIDTTEVLASRRT